MVQTVVSRMRKVKHVCSWQRNLKSRFCLEVMIISFIAGIFTCAKCKFSPSDAMLVRYMLSSCVYLSRYCIKTAKCTIMQTTPYNSPGTLVFWSQRSLRYSNRVSGVTPVGATNRGGVGSDWLFPTNISLYLIKRCKLGL